MSAIASGATIATALAVGAPPSVTALLGWDAAALVFVTLVWLTTAPMAAAATAASAQAEDASRTEGEAILVGAGTASLVAAGLLDA